MGTKAHGQHVRLSLSCELPRHPPSLSASSESIGSSRRSRMIPTTQCWLAPGARHHEDSVRPQLPVREHSRNISNISNILVSGHRLRPCLRYPKCIMCVFVSKDMSKSDLRHI